MFEVSSINRGSRSSFVQIDRFTPVLRSDDRTSDTNVLKVLAQKSACNLYTLKSSLKSKLKKVVVPAPEPVKQAVDFEKIKRLNIPNFSQVDGHGVRGESLSSPKNRKYLPLVKKAGIETIIDIRDKYASKAFPELCKEQGLNYYNLPIDSSSVSDRTIIDNFPIMFNILNNDNYYIACAQGLHRTDIALALNFVFNPQAKEPPVLKGHYRRGDFVFDDISRRLNSIKHSITSEELSNLGWDDTFTEEFIKRKNVLKDFNTSLFLGQNS